MKGSTLVELDSIGLHLKLQIDSRKNTSRISLLMIILKDIFFYSFFLTEEKAYHKDIIRRQTFLKSKIWKNSNWCDVSTN